MQYHICHIYIYILYCKSCSARYKPHSIELDTVLKPFIPELIPSIGEVGGLVSFGGGSRFPYPLLASIGESRIFTLAEGRIGCFAGGLDYEEFGTLAFSGREKKTQILYLAHSSTVSFFFVHFFPSSFHEGTLLLKFSWACHHSTMPMPNWFSLSPNVVLCDQHGVWLCIQTKTVASHGIPTAGKLCLGVLRKTTGG